MSPIIGLHDPQARDVALVGGKAANLAALIAAGFAVPGGFCVPTSAYAEAAATAGLPALLAGAADDLAHRASAALLAAPVPVAVERAVTAAYAALGADVPVAVRSSATAEDLPTASFAGQQDTFLHVIGADALIEAVRRCWASLWTDRAVSYRSTTGIDHANVQLAVVVQRMVDAHVAGVLFTADPLSGRRTRSVIDAAPGLGEAVVSGAVDPDHVVVDTAGDGAVTISEHRLPRRRGVLVRPRPGGGVDHVGDHGGAVTACLSDADIRELVAVGQRVEALFGAPQDIEWALDGDAAVWLTQSRPITTLYPLVGTPGQRGRRVFFNISLAQGLTRPITPMGLSAFRVIAATASRVAFRVPVDDPRQGPPAFVAAGGRAFVDVTAALRNPVGRAIVPRLLDIMEARSAVVFRRLRQQPEFAPRFSSGPRTVWRLLRLVLRFRVPGLVALALIRPVAARRRVDGVRRRVDAVTAMSPTLPGPDRLDRVERVLAGVFPILPTVFPAAVAGLVSMALARRLAGADLDDETADEVLRSLPHNPTTEMDLELWALARRVRGDAATAAAVQSVAPPDLAGCYRRRQLPALLQDGLREFLDRYGHRAVAEIDVGLPRWSDDPTHVLGALINYLRLDDPEHAPDVQFARGARAADAAVAAVVARVGRRSRLRARLLRGALHRVRELAGLREVHKDLLVRLLAHTRAELAVIGRELVGRGAIDAAEDVFFLDLPEVRTALGGVDHRDAVAVRRTEYAHELRRRHVPRILLSDGTEPEATVPAGAATIAGDLTGTPASAGTVTAPVRVVLDPIGAHLEPGEILVAPSTDPGWTPLFLTAGGLIMEMGGPVSHGAVVAREYGIPAVVGVAAATERLISGDVVTLDGAAGVIRPVGQPRPGRTASDPVAVAG